MRIPLSLFFRVVAADEERRGATCREEREGRER